MQVKNKVQLITYPDSLGGDLNALEHVLEQHFPDTFMGGIHILPPFPSSGDRGFAPLTYLEIDPAFGTWEDVRRLGKKYDLLLDLMVNHISAKSEYFLDFLENGQDSSYADLFLSIEKLWPDGSPSREEIEKIFLRRKEPYSDFTIKSTGEKVRVWTTFGKMTPSEQIDLDINSDATRQLLSDFFANFGENHVRIVRLDAVAYVTKKPGTSCFFIEPEIYQFLEWLTDLAEKHDIVLLPEVHAHYSVQNKLSERGYWIYDFILPYLVLETIIHRDATKLGNYLKDRPAKQFTMLDCHDGVPIKPDLNDLYDSAEARKIVDICLERGSNLSLIFSPKHQDADGFDVHQVRGTYYSMLGCDDDAYLVARAIQFFTPGVPQVYYVGLLAGENDQEAVDKSGEGREINRHNYTFEEIEQAVNQEVVQRLIKLIHFRNRHPAFDGEMTAVETDGETFSIRWENGTEYAELRVDLGSYQFEVFSSGEGIDQNSR
ncbi:MAG: sucrose phosphorylase [Anaerolineales bacterium]|nr:sucrose phosphorylase [Anaerolineales bacterium]